MTNTKQDLLSELDKALLLNSQVEAILLIINTNITDFSTLDISAALGGVEHLLKESDRITSKVYADLIPILK